MNKISEISNSWITSIIAWLVFYGIAIKYCLHLNDVSPLVTIILLFIVILCLFLATLKPTHALVHQYRKYNLKFLERSSVNILASIIFALIIAVGCVFHTYTPAMILYIIIVPFVLSIFNSLSLINN